MCVCVFDSFFINVFFRKYFLCGVAAVTLITIEFGFCAYFTTHICLFSLHMYDYNSIYVEKKMKKEKGDKTEETAMKNRYSFLM